MYKTIVIEEIQEENPTFKTFRFRPGHGLEYKAGQYLTFVDHTHGHEIRRSYSMVSAPLLGEPLTIGVKRIENGAFSRKLVDHARSGDELLTTGPGGLFTLPENLLPIKQIFFLAAGSGITPILSLLKTVLHFHQHISVVLIYSNPSPEKALFLSTVHALKKLFPGRLHLELIFSNTRDLTRARINRESLAHLLHQHSIAIPEDRLHYICGPEAYMRMCTYTLQEGKVPAAGIRKENFLIPKKATAVEPPDKGTHMVTIHWEQQLYHLQVTYPDTILTAAKKQKISLPYSCDAGRCGNCVVRVLRGTVWLSYNEVLTENDIQNRLSLTCVGHPVDGDVELEIDS